MRIAATGVPHHWATVALGQIAEVRLGRQRSPKRAVGDHMRPYLRAANVTWEGVSLHDVKEMDFTPSEFGTYGLKPGDILLAEASGSASEVGKPAVWKGEIPNCCFQNTLIRVRVDRNLVPFLHLHFVKDALTGSFASASRGVGIHHLGAEAMTEWAVSIPPLPEQHRIVEAIESYFTRLDDAVATLERVQRNLKRYRASVLKAAVEGRLVPTEAELARAEDRDYEPASVLLDRILAERRCRWEESGRRGRYEEPLAPDTSGLPTLPEGWCWGSVDQLSYDVRYGTSAKTAECPDGGVPVLRMGNIAEGVLDFSTLKYLPADHDEFPDLLLESGDLLFNRTNSAELVGKSAVFHQWSQPCSFASYLIRVRFSSGIEPDFVAHHINSHAGRSWIASVVSQQVGQANVNGTKLRACSVPVPPSAEQARIVVEVDRLLSIGSASASGAAVSHQRCTRLRQSILKWAFEGKLADQDPSGEPASALLERIKAEREVTGLAKKTGRLGRKKPRAA